MRDMLTLQQAGQWLENARLVAQDADHGVTGGAVTFRRVHTDTRTLQPGDLILRCKDLMACGFQVKTEEVAG